MNSRFEQISIKLRLNLRNSIFSAIEDILEQTYCQDKYCYANHDDNLKKELVGSPAGLPNQ